jgi:hypothetical protein
MTDTEYGARLHDRHAKMLAESGITPEHARARGYISIDSGNRRRLKEIGVVKAVQKSDGLLIPLLRIDGEVGGYQFRPDTPRIKDGKELKYETPFRQPNMIDFPPGTTERLADRSMPVWITEGVKKADAGYLAGLGIVGLTGTWNWLRDGGALPDFRDLALKNREVILCFDSDITIKDGVWKAVRDLGEWLKVSRQANVKYCLLPHNGDGKTGLDDYLAAGHTVDDLMQLVQPHLPALDSSDTPHAADSGKRIPLVPDTPIGGNVLLQNIRGWLGTYISTLADTDLDLLTLWAAHTHLVFETYTTPRLLIDSPVPESGKTTVIEHLQRLCLRGVQIASLASPALLTRMLDIERRTILIDEADRSLNPDKEGIADLMSIINTGYKRGATRPVLVPGGNNQWEVAEMPTFAAVAMAGNNPNLPDDTRSRSIRVLLLPDLDGTVEESNWEEIEEEAGELHDQLFCWAEQVREDVRTNRPGLPDGIIGRFREKWSPLKRVAVAAGGDWPDRVDEMAVQDKKAYEMNKEDGLIQEKPAIVLLRHIHEVWPSDKSFLPTTDLIDQLIDLYPSKWGSEGPFGKPLTAKRLGGMLAKSYNIHSDQPTHGGPRGYHRPAFLKPWTRMGVTTSSTSYTHPPHTSDASDESEESDEGSSESSDTSDASDTRGGRSDNANMSTKCKGCGADLWFPASQIRGTCELCHRKDRQREAS